jgi:hypothetical protein
MVKSVEPRRVRIHRRHEGAVGQQVEKTDAEGVERGRRGAWRLIWESGTGTRCHALGRAGRVHASSLAACRR